MDLRNLIAKLHPFERQVLPVLKEHKEISEITAAANVKDIEAMRAIQWLANKDVLIIHTEKIKVIKIDENGKLYQKVGLPEKRLLLSLSEELKGLNVVSKKSKLTREEVSACIGLLKQKKAIEIKKVEDNLELKITDFGKQLLQQPWPEEQFLAKQFPIIFQELNENETKTAAELQKRKKMIAIEEKKNITIELTELGQELVSLDLGAQAVNRLTTGMLKTGEWKDKIFRAYDVQVNVPPRYPGKKHFVNQAVEYIKKIWLEMGFKEMSGNYVQSAFWDLDSLFVPQDHPAREMQDTYYLQGKARLPEEIVEKVRQTHENGSDTGSSGWQYHYSHDEAAKIMLRTHTTVLSARTLAMLKKEDLPAKFFVVGKVFRNETLDWKHLFEFFQVEGIVVDLNANLKHLKGYLTQFYKKMGYTKVRMRPGFFPYVEPGLEVDVFHPTRKEWVELGGAGIFRPEVTKTLLGFECPVLAWGQGMERIISEYWKITDIRELNKNDVKQLREQKMWLK